MNDPSQTPPARPRQLSVKFDDLGESLRLVHRGREWGGGCFLALWLIGWTVGCVFLANQAIREPKLSIILFGVPFWASWLFVFALVLRMFFQREEFTLGPQGVTFVRRIIVPINRREIPLAEIKVFGFCQKIVNSESGQCQSGLELQTLGQPLHIAAGLSEPELAWLKYELSERLARLQKKTFAPEPDTESDLSQVPAERLNASNAGPLQPPSDSRWQRIDDFDALAISKRGRLSLSAIGGLLFINAFWNGVVSVFICMLCGLMGGKQPQGAGWWGLFVFLFPFEVIGLIMFIALLLAVLEPVRRTTWRIGHSEVVRRLTWLGIGPKWTYWINKLDRIELRGDENKNGRTGFRHSFPWKSQEASFGVSLIDKSNVEVCTIDNLSEGEARWMADTIRLERPIWFR